MQMMMSVASSAVVVPRARGQWQMSDTGLRQRDRCARLVTRSTRAMGGSAGGTLETTAAEPVGEAIGPKAASGRPGGRGGARRGEGGQGRSRSACVEDGREGVWARGCVDVVVCRRAMSAGMLSRPRGA